MKSQDGSKGSGRVGTVKLVIDLDTNDPYAIATISGYRGDVSFSLGSHRNVWQGGPFPKPGAQVILFNIQRINGKWRAHQARLYGPDDEDKQ